MQMSKRHVAKDKVIGQSIVIKVPVKMCHGSRKNEIGVHDPIKTPEEEVSLPKRLANSGAGG